MDRDYGIGRVLGGGMEVVKRGFVPLFLIALVFAAVPILLNLFVLMPAMGGLNADPLAQQAAMADMNWGVFALVVLVSLVFASASYPALIRGATRLLDGEPIAVMEEVRHGIGRALPYFVLTIIGYVALAIGFTLLIVPGILLMIRWSASAQALTNEDIGPIAALGRSNDLTRGSRWRTFLLFLVAAVVLFAFGLLITALAGILAAAGLGLVYFIVQALLSLAVGVYFFGVLAAHYLELRRVREGDTPGRLAEVFA